MTTLLTRRGWLRAAASGVALLLIGKRAWPARIQGRKPGEVTAYRSPTCGCCGKWIDRMRETGFTVTERRMDDVTPIKREHSVPEDLYSCHTAVGSGYVFEGHVPPDLVARVLRERPAIRGLAVPGMPASAPGMETGPGRYDVISFTRTGKTSVYAVRS